MDGMQLAIEFEQSKEPAEDAAIAYYFSVQLASLRLQPATKRIYVVKFSRDTKKSNDVIGTAWLPFAMERLLATIPITDSPAVGEDYVIIPVTPQDMQNWRYDMRKCRHQVQGKTGLDCEAAHDTDLGETTLALCGTCELPDERIRCSHLVHYGVAYSGQRQQRRIAAQKCEFGKKEVSNAINCRAGGHSCWEKIIRLPTALDALEEGLEERACDEVDHWNLAFRHLHSRRPVQPVQLRTVKELVTPCQNERDLKAKVQALADMISKLDVQLTKPLPEDQTGAVKKLEAFYTEHGYGAGEAIGILRAITQLRQDFPTHSGNERVLSACATLGISYPPSDWAGTWRLILRAFTGAVRILRLALPPD